MHVNISSYKKFYKSWIKLVTNFQTFSKLPHKPSPKVAFFLYTNPTPKI